MRSDWACFRLILRQGGLLAWRSSARLWQSLAFFVLVMVMFAIALGQNPGLLQKTAPGVIWVGVLLAMLIHLDRGFREECRTGALDIWLTSIYPLSWLVLAKVISDWLMVILPLLILQPLIGLLLGLSSSVIGTLSLTLLLGTPTLYFLGAIFSALVVSFQQSSWLMALLLLPLTVPIFILGCGACESVALGHAAVFEQTLLATFLLMAVCVCPFVIAGALRIGLRAS